jgi:hypothetical protein
MPYDIKTKWYLEKRRFLFLIILKKKTLRRRPYIMPVDMDFFEYTLMGKIRLREPSI